MVRCLTLRHHMTNLSGTATLTRLDVAAGATAEFFGSASAHLGQRWKSLR